MNNGHQMVLGWSMYADDNVGNLVYNRDGTGAGKSLGNECWVGGWLDLTANNTDNTNLNYLMTHDERPFQPFSYCGYLGVYIKNPAAFKCPADHVLVTEGSQLLPRARSYSMNNYVGAESRTWTSPSRFTLFKKSQQITSPANLFVYLDERSDSINDGWYASDPDTLYQVIDFPADYHGNAAGYGFADGHSEIHRFRDSRTTPPFNPNGIPLNVNLNGDHDVFWMAQHAAGVAQYP